MASITIRKLDDTLKDRLRKRAAEHGHSMEEETREILRLVLSGDRQRGGENMAATIRRRFAPLGGVELELPPREPLREPPQFKE